jgi:predicted nucleic acid-binding protein
LHAAVMERRTIRSILTFDKGFDALVGVRRLT